MKDYTKGTEPEYYNEKLIKDGLKDELGKPFRPDRKQLIINIAGSAVGFIIRDAADTESLIGSSAVRFAADVLIVTASITVVNAAVYLIKKASGKTEA